MANFRVETKTSTSLNFLIYVQNLYLSQRELGKFHFPSYRVPFSVFHENFEENFRILWNTIVDSLEESHDYDLKLFHERKKLFSQQLFNGQAVFTVKFEDIYRSFQDWWGSFAGSFAIERAAEEKVKQLYGELMDGQQEGLNSKLTVFILYDDCALAEHRTTSTLAITSIPELHIRYTDVVERIFV